MNVNASAKKELLKELIDAFQNASYSDGKKRELIDQTQVKLKFVTPESSESILKRLSESGRVMVYGSDPKENHRNQVNAFETFKKTAISQFNALITEVELTEKFASVTFAKVSPVILPNNKIFIVHGHNDDLKTSVARFIERQGLEAVILHEQASGGQTIIEKLEHRSDVGFAIILYTPCDLGRVATSEKSDEKPRARQNVVFEHGFFIGKIGRGKVVALTKGDIEIPNDYSGVVYVQHDVRGAWKVDIARELKHAGYNIDVTKF
ncbi:TIR domain-containing protein [Exiguobacterium aurantiacum]|uniref:TIR domain-containing protein n=1 Tax=Exiguobacterium aurantiacum TaxID=33987 RepID=UPI00384F210B